MANTELFWSKVLKTENCWEWKGCRLKRPNQNISYGQIKWNKKTIYAHRLSWLLTFGIIPDNVEVCHKCDNPICVRPDHLFLGTHSENMRDAKDKKRTWSPSGENHYAAKLTEKQVIEIKNSHLSQRELARQYFIFSGKNWKGFYA